MKIVALLTHKEIVSAIALAYNINADAVKVHYNEDSEEAVAQITIDATLESLTNQESRAPQVDHAVMESRLNALETKQVVQDTNLAEKEEHKAEAVVEKRTRRSSKQVAEDKLAEEKAKQAVADEASETNEEAADSLQPVVDGIEADSETVATVAEAPEEASVTQPTSRRQRRAALAQEANETASAEVNASAETEEATAEEQPVQAVTGRPRRRMFANKG